MIAVTGATSNTGKAVAFHLLEAGAQVRVIGRSLDRLQPFIKRGAEPFVAIPSDAKAMKQAFQGADAVYVMLQPGFIADSTDFPAYQQASIDAMIPALVVNKVRYVVALSGWGANYEEASGPLFGLRQLENRLRAEPSLHTIALRPGWFMENAMPLIGAIRKNGTASSQLRGDLKLPLIATRDIGELVADLLQQPIEKGFSIREVQGPEEMTLAEAVKIIGSAAGFPNAIYKQLQPGDVKAEMIESGFSDPMAQAFVEMSEDLNAERIRMLRPKSERIITPTKFEQFVYEVLAQV